MEESVIEQTIAVKRFAEELGLRLVYSGCEELRLDTVNVSRPGLALAGFTDYFGENRIQVLGNAEMEYLLAESSEGRKKALSRLCEGHQIPCVIVCHNRDVFPELVQTVERFRLPLFVTDRSTTSLINLLVMYLNKLLAPSLTMHAGLMDVYGMGILIIGKSGIGKSETALELIKRGHRLIADDSVVVKRIDDELIGTCPEIIRYFMELRGIGIIDVRALYGIGSVLQEKSVDLVVELEDWNEQKQYDRLGDEPMYTDILGVRVPKFTVPVKPGRNLSIIMEVAARNARLKAFGYDAAKEIIARSYRGDKEE
ncbi:MAG: HPr(Ser) kinase/phosphatase [Clostridia bacterium]|nr:HPr(Ser) kinase/phosphatase [Clostridia bacterium]